MFGKREPERTELAPELKALEQQLAALALVPPRIDRDKLMFEAGRAAAQPGGLGYIAEPSGLGTKFWPAATYTMTAASLLLATMLVWQQHSMSIAQKGATSQAVVEQLVVHQPAAATLNAPRHEMTMTGWTAFRQPTSGYLGDRYIALTRGIGALEPRYPVAQGDRDSSSDVQRTQRDMLNELLPSTTHAAKPRS